MTPFCANGDINENALGDLIEHALKLGADGFYCCGSTAEVFMLSDDERRALMRMCIDAADGRCTLFAHVGAVSTREAVSLARYAEKLGYDAVSAVAPFYYKFSPKEIAEHYKAIADAVDLPVIVYNIPALSGVSLGLDGLSELLADGRFMGVKHTSLDLFELETLKFRFPDKIIYNGYDEMFLPGLSAGADGGIGSTYNFAADKFVEIRRCFNSGNIAKAQAVQHEMNEIIRVLCKVGVTAGEKAVLRLLGIDMGECRRPFSPCSAEDIALIEREIMPHIAVL